MFGTQVEKKKKKDYSLSVMKLKPVKHVYILIFQKKELQRQGSPDIVIGLAGNKCDLEDKRKVSKEVFVIYFIERERGVCVCVCVCELM